MRALFRIVLLIICTSLVACATQSVSTSNKQTSTNEHQKWTTAELQGSTWQLIDDRRVENMSFYPGGFLAMTIGVKTATGSTIMAPVFHWTINSEGALVIYDNKGNVYEKLYKIESDAQRVTVDFDGKVQYYDKLK